MIRKPVRKHGIQRSRHLALFETVAEDESRPPHIDPDATGALVVGVDLTTDRIDACTHPVGSASGRRRYGDVFGGSVVNPQCIYRIGAERGVAGRYGRVDRTIITQGRASG